jgi:hypothetical protein
LRVNLPTRPRAPLRPIYAGEHVDLAAIPPRKWGAVYEDIRANFLRLFASSRKPSANVEQSSAADRSPRSQTPAVEALASASVESSEPKRKVHAYEEIVAIMSRARTVFRNAMQQFFLPLHDSACYRNGAHSCEDNAADGFGRDGIPEVVEADNFRASSKPKSRPCRIERLPKARRPPRKSEKIISRRANPRDCALAARRFRNFAFPARARAAFFPPMLTLFRLADARVDARYVRRLYSAH